MIGIWPKDVKKDHINCAHATSSTIVTGDDHGAINLYTFPCPEPGVSAFDELISYPNLTMTYRRYINRSSVIPTTLLTCVSWPTNGTSSVWAAMIAGQYNAFFLIAIFFSISFHFSIFLWKCIAKSNGEDDD